MDRFGSGLLLKLLFRCFPACTNSMWIHMYLCHIIPVLVAPLYPRLSVRVRPTFTMQEVPILVMRAFKRENWFNAPREIRPRQYFSLFSQHRKVYYSFCLGANILRQQPPNTQQLWDFPHVRQNAEVSKGLLSVERSRRFYFQEEVSPPQTG